MNVKGFIFKEVYKLKKNSPEIMFGVGIVGAIGATVWACKQTLKEAKDIEYHNERLEAVDEVYCDIDLCEESEEKRNALECKKKEVRAIYKETIKRSAKNYAGPLALAVLSYGFMTKGFMTERDRYLSASAAAATFSAMYNNYRQNVIEKYGKEEDFNLRYGVKNQEVEEIKKLKNGNEKVVKTNIKTINDISAHSEYSRFFDATSPHYYKDAGLNLSFLVGIQEWANRELKIRGHLFLNEVYRELGLEESRAGQFVGWRYDPNDPSGDNEIDFNIFSYEDANRRFVNGYEPVILLDFNVDGNILDIEFPRT